ncbi:uncharacterized protein LOC134571033 [Pelobates fuscus]|uniref:uncharacterized protein LOC134571033 n=1 Tax=Pelobates fuscus TaxID=191477 RepID=UPI002FE43001
MKMSAQNKVIGIFSRESEESYKWLIPYLASLHGVKDVRPVYIPVNDSRVVSREVSKCSFAILYHTKNRGRINITDVTDSIYDRELETLSARLGKNNVIVVIDDLDDVSETHKIKILRNQPKIANLARELFLFNDDKSNNLEMIKNIIQEYALPKYFIWMIFAIIVIVLVIIVACLLRSQDHSPTDTTTTVPMNMSTTMTTDITTTLPMNMSTTMTTDITTTLPMNMSTTMTTDITTTLPMNISMNVTTTVTMNMTTNITINMTLADMPMNVTTKTPIDTTTERSSMFHPRSSSSTPIFTPSATAPNSSLVP